VSKRRLTKQRWDAIISAMAYYETMIEQGEIGEGGFVEPHWKQERRHYESAMEWLRSVRPESEVTR